MEGVAQVQGIEKEIWASSCFSKNVSPGPPPPCPRTSRYPGIWRFFSANQGKSLFPKCCLRVQLSGVCLATNFLVLFSHPLLPLLVVLCFKKTSLDYCFSEV